MVLESWLEQATHGLAPASVAKVRAEIEEHVESAMESELSRGVLRDRAELAAIESLGSPKAANREYRKVLMTKADVEALELMKVPHAIGWPLYFQLAAAVVAGAVLGVIVLLTIVSVLQPDRLATFPPPKYIAFFASMAGAVGIAAVVFALQGWRRSNPGAKQAVVALVGHAIPFLTSGFAVVSYSYFGLSLTTRLWAGSTLILFVTVTASTWPIYTPKRSRKLRPFRWAAILVGLFVIFGANLMTAPAVTVIIFHGYFRSELRRHSLRKKLPVEQWPPALYL